MKKIFSLFAIIFSSLILLTGCNTFKAYTFKVETGDKIKIELDTSKGYDLSSDVPFTISKDGESLSMGTFIDINGYNQYIDSIKTDTDAKILDSGNKKGITYTFYSYKNKEFNYVIKIDNSDTGVILGNKNSEKEAEEVFKRLTFSLK